jgi:hypothetical protein
MGFVEVGGNGSVLWHAQHDRGTHGHANPNGAWGRDDIPPRGSGAVFTILIDNKPVAGLPALPVDTTKISIRWGAHGAGNPPPDTQEGDVPMGRDKVQSHFDTLPTQAASAATDGKGGRA